ncbi:MAG: hypothetical protein L0099_15755, partial [Acidobacteria bacterium]|nr:hypothetical protein [Acidobacteriota bacterium]
GPSSSIRSEKTTEVLNNIDITVYALYFLGGIEKIVHTEDMANKCYELAPQSFAWTKFPRYPEREKVSGTFLQNSTISGL